MSLCIFNGIFNALPSMQSAVFWVRKTCFEPILDPKLRSTVLNQGTMNIKIRRKTKAQSNGLAEPIMPLRDGFCLEGPMLQPWNCSAGNIRILYWIFSCKFRSDVRNLSFGSMKTFPMVSLRHDTIDHDSQLWKEAEHSNNARHANQTHPRCVWLVVTVAIPKVAVFVSRKELNFINGSLILHLVCDFCCHCSHGHPIQNQNKGSGSGFGIPTQLHHRVWAHNTNDLGLNKITTTRLFSSLTGHATGTKLSRKLHANRALARFLLKKFIHE